MDQQRLDAVRKAIQMMKEEGCPFLEFSSGEFSFKLQMPVNPLEVGNARPQRSLTDALPEV
jgi:hypothetical protein